METYIVFIVLCGFLYIDSVSSQNFTSDPRCPPIESVPAICDYMCYDGPEKHMREALACKAGQICCPTECKGRACVSLKDIPDQTVCASMPCLNGGVCRSTGKTYTCECKPGYSGNNCDVFDPCDSNPCQNGGGCLLGSDFVSYSCYCPLGFTGQYCQTNIDECAVNPCQNGGKCVDGINGFVCQCRQDPDGTTYTGQYCEVVVRPDPCAQNPCANGGYCTASTDRSTYTCTCQSGFTGRKCRKREELCPPNQDLFNCMINPCLYQTCSGVPGAECRPDYCGGCNARFYVNNFEVTDICTFGFSFW